MLGEPTCRLVDDEFPFRVKERAMCQTIQQRILRAAVAVMLAMLMSGVLFQAADTEHHGKIKSVSSSRIIVATVADASVTFQIGEQTEITIRGRPAGPGDLKPGDFVRVSSAESDGGTLMAVRIAVSR